MTSGNGEIVDAQQKSFYTVKIARLIMDLFHRLGIFPLICVMQDSEVVDITNEEVDRWIKDATLYAINSIKVSNSGGFSAEVRNGVYTVTKNRHTELRRTSNLKVLYHIFTKLVDRYQNIEYKGFRYYYDRGTWRRFKVKNDC